jgi:predicted DNA-binding transcriptional regulator YafY
MRHEKAYQVLELARLLAGTAEGLTLDEMAQRMGVGRRTAERMRDAVRELFPQLEELEDPPTKRFRISAGLDSFHNAPTADELVALRTAAEALAASGAQSRAAALQVLEQKILAATRAAQRRRLAPDLEALLQAETIAVQAGPRPYEDAAVLGTLREAIKSMRRLSFRYEGGSTPGRRRTVTPFGILFGRSNYLVAAEAGVEPRNWRLDRIFDIEVTGEAGAAPEGFSLQDYADESFGIYHDAVEDVVLKVAPHGADDAVRWRFHTNQTVTPQDDGSVIVAFRASGMRELAWHLFTWQDKLTILAPERLRVMMRDELEMARKTHG